MEEKTEVIDIQMAENGAVFTEYEMTKVENIYL